MLFFILFFEQFDSIFKRILYISINFFDLSVQFIGSISKLNISLPKSDKFLF